VYVGVQVTGSWKTVPLLLVWHRISFCARILCSHHKSSNQTIKKSNQEHAGYLPAWDRDQEIDSYITSTSRTSPGATRSPRNVGNPVARRGILPASPVRENQRTSTRELVSLSRAVKVPSINQERIVRRMIPVFYGTWRIIRSRLKNYDSTGCYIGVSSGRPCSCLYGRIRPGINRQVVTGRRNSTMLALEKGILFFGLPCWSARERW
jgi:hypothetical protein